MPLYTYECHYCGERQDRVFRVNKFPKTVKCTQCGKPARKIIALGHGGVKCDSIVNVTWLPSAIKNLPNDAAFKVESRTDHKRYLKERGLVATG
jgi:putative FmdB family regulatory protein